jgi:hypothetical protein
MHHEDFKDLVQRLVNGRSRLFFWRLVNTLYWQVTVRDLVCAANVSPASRSSHVVARRVSSLALSASGCPQWPRVSQHGVQRGPSHHQQMSGGSAPSAAQRPQSSMRRVYSAPREVRSECDRRSTLAAQGLRGESLRPLRPTRRRREVAPGRPRRAPPTCRPSVELPL